MRLADLGDYRRLRGFADNPWETLRFRKSHAPGRDLEVRLSDGRRILLRGGCQDFHIFHRIFLRDEYRLDETAPGSLDTVIDLGANVGLFSLRVSPLARRVICYEPVAENVAVLERNLRGLEGVQVVAEAVSEGAGTVRLRTPAAEGMSGRFSIYERVGGIGSEGYRDVPAVGLDELFARHAVTRCSLLKLDVEGAEYGILRGASSEILTAIDRIRGEYHDVEPRGPGDDVNALVHRLEEHGFRVEVSPHRRKPNLGHFFATRLPASTDA